MFMKRIRMLAMAVALASAGCASDSGGGITGSGLVIGQITAFGSIFVQGIEFDVDRADIDVDGMPGAQSDLALGMIVAVRGVVDADTATGVASSVSYDSEVQGPVDSVDAGSGTIIVLGQVILTDATTVFEDTTLATLAAGDVVEVSGFIDADGNVRATRVARKDENESEIRGLIAELDSQAQTFRIGGQLVDYSEAELENVPSSGLADGLFVDVRSTRGSSGGVLLADRVNVEDESFEGEGGLHVDIEGVVSRVDSATEFVLNGTRPVRTTSMTEFQNGTAADIQENVELEVRGTVGSDGVLVADRVEFHD
jgi:hypothetical protein